MVRYSDIELFIKRSKGEKIPETPQPKKQRLPITPKPINELEELKSEIIKLNEKIVKRNKTIKTLMISNTIIAALTIFLAPLQLSALLGVLILLSTEMLIFYISINSY